jgi:hypothetical protein
MILMHFKAKNTLNRNRYHNLKQAITKRQKPCLGFLILKLEWIWGETQYNFGSIGFVFSWVGPFTMLTSSQKALLIGCIFYV